MIRYTIRGADKVAADLAAASGEQVIAQGTAAAAPVLKRSIVTETPERSGDLKRSEDVLVVGSSLEFRAGMFYADFVRDGTTRMKGNDYQGRGTDAAEFEVVGEFVAAASQFTSEFGS